MGVLIVMFLIANIILKRFVSRPCHVAAQMHHSQTLSSCQAIRQIQNGSIVELTIRQVKLNQLRVIFNEMLETFHNLEIFRT